MRRYSLYFALSFCFTISGISQNDTDTLSQDSIYEWNDSMSYEERESWINSLMNQHYALLAKESDNFDSLRPFLVNKIRECDTYYAIEVIDSTKIFHYTVVSPKTKKKKQKGSKDITEGSVCYFNLHALTKYTGKFGCSEVLHDITFEVNGVKVRYISSDVIDAPPVCTENLNGLRYVKKAKYRKQPTTQK